MSAFTLGLPCKYKVVPLELSPSINKKVMVFIQHLLSLCL